MSGNVLIVLPSLIFGAMALVASWIARAEGLPFLIWGIIPLLALILAGKTIFDILRHNGESQKVFWGIAEEIKFFPEWHDTSSHKIIPAHKAIRLSGPKPINGFWLIVPQMAMSVGDVVKVRLVAGFDGTLEIVPIKYGKKR